MSSAKNACVEGYQTPSPVKSTDKIRSTRSHQRTYCQLQANVSVFNYLLFQRVIRVWNLLPSGVMSFSTLSCFRHSALPAIRSLKVPSHLHRL